MPKMTHKISKKTPTYSDVFNTYGKRFQSAIDESNLLHSYLKNIKKSGDEGETAVKQLLSELLPKRYRVTYGYIVKATNKEGAPVKPIISPEVDVIINKYTYFKARWRDLKEVKIRRQ